jgi:large subunit ribosomal protein L4
MKLSIKDLNGNQQGELEVKFSLVEGGRGTQAVHDTVTAYRANQRMGTACTKTVGEVSGSNKKPWRQKGTGRARAGSHQSPLWVGGGVVFGPRPRDFSKKVNTKTKQLALRKALTERLKAGDVVLVEEFNLAGPKTKEFIGVLSALQVQGTALIVAPVMDKNLVLASRNIADVELTSSASLNTYQVLRADKLIFTRAAFEQVEERLKRD